MGNIPYTGRNWKSFSISLLLFFFFINVKLQSKIQGDLGSYDGSGYYYDFNKTTTQSQLTELLGEMNKRSWFDGNMNALFLQINYFELTKKYFVTITQVKNI